jgi:hypothetical protein
MRLSRGLHLAYCTNIHRGETWEETFHALKAWTLEVKRQVCPRDPYAIGLRLSNRAANELRVPAALLEFRKWLDREGCYVFTINGFPYGQFHGARVKEQVYLPDWSSPERVGYTNMLFDLLSEIIPPGVEGSVSTVPCGFKQPPATAEKWQAIYENVLASVGHVAGLCQRTGKRMHLGLEPEPLCLLETTGETIEFFEKLCAHSNGDGRIEQHLGVNYDACHLAVEFEDARQSIEALRRNKIRISKIHLSSALQVRPREAAMRELKKFCEPVYLHQVVAKDRSGALRRFVDLPEALEDSTAAGAEEWRIHFHVPLHSPNEGMLGTTVDHLRAVLDIISDDPALCSHLEMETYTWETLPPNLRSNNVVDQLVAEYRWVLDEFGNRGIHQNARVGEP